MKAYLAMLAILFRGPFLLTLFAGVVFVVLHFWVPAAFELSLEYPLLSDRSRSLAPVFSLLILFAASMWSLFPLYNLWKWYKGEIPACYECGAIMVRKEGMRGVYFRCIRYPICPGRNEV